MDRMCIGQVLVTVMVFGLTACESTGPGPSSIALVPPPLPSSVTGRQTDSAPIQRTTVSERSTVGPDGSIRTTRTTTSVGFDPDRAATAANALLSAAARPGDGSLPGTWTSRSSSTGVGCTVALYGDASATQGSAASACNAGSVLAGVSSWRYENGRLVLLKGSEEALALNRAGPHRFDGTAKWGFLTTTITLFR